MNSRFGMTYVAIHAAQARARAAELQQREAASTTRPAPHRDEEGAVRRMVAILVLFIVVAGVVVWLTA